MPRLVYLGLGCAGLMGCMTPKSPESKTSQAMNRQMDTLSKMGEDLSRKEQQPPTYVLARSQTPGEPSSQGLILPAMPAKTNITPPISSTESKVVQLKDAITPLNAQAQVRIVANVGNTPIYESEVRESINKRVNEFGMLSETERKPKVQQIYLEELRKIIERELILDEMFARLKANASKSGKGNVIEELQDAAKEEAARQLREIRMRAGIPKDEDFGPILQTQGLSLNGMRRELERNFMMRTYLQQMLREKVSNITLGDMRDYYEQHPDEFQADDNVKWQDIFVSLNKFNNKTEAKRYADSLITRTRNGEDFLELAKQYDHGFGKGIGEGEKRGEIRPLEVESILFTLRPGDVSLVEMETGYHVVRVQERTYAGIRPFNEKTQLEARRKLQNLISEKEYRRIVETLRRRNPPQIFVEQLD